MKVISAQDGKLVRLQEQEHAQAAAPGIFTGFEALDNLLPPCGLKLGAVHELLYSAKHPAPLVIAACLARGKPPAEAQAKALPGRYLAWFDPDQTLYPPALRAIGIDLSRLLIIRPDSHRELLWALAECLRCTAMGGVICPVDELSRVQARKLQLAAEQGGTLGCLLRPQTRHAAIYAAATRWLVEPAAGERSLQRWKVQLLHGHGGHPGSTVYLEQRHDQTHLLRATDALADRPHHPARTPGLRIA